MVMGREEERSAIGDSQVSYVILALAVSRRPDHVRIQFPSPIAFNTQDHVVHLVLSFNLNPSPITLVTSPMCSGP